MAYRFMKNEKLAGAVRRVFLAEIDWAVGRLTQPGKREEAVHEARKSVKKIRALLGLIKTPLGAEYKAADGYFRDSGRLLSAARDARVMLDVFDEIAKKDVGLDVEARRDIRLNLLRNQRSLRAEKPLSEEVVRRLNEARPMALQWPLEGLEWAALAKDLAAAYRSGRAQLKGLVQKESGAAFHNLRKAVKQHWYQLKLIEEFWDPEMRQRAAELRSLETSLGDEHNLAVLSDRIAADVETSDDRRQAQRVLAVLAGQQRELRQRALGSGLKLYAAKAKEFGVQLARLWTVPRTPRKRPAVSVVRARSAVA